MKKLFFVAVLFVLALSILFFKSNKKNEPVLGDVDPKPELRSEIQTFELSFGGRELLVYYFETDGSSTWLHPNFEEKLPASELLKNSSCEALVNGGFYFSDPEMTENSPVGLFVTNSEIKSAYRPNKTHDGILSINEVGTPLVTREPVENAISAVQTGPILKENGSYIDLTIRNDKPARRIIAGVTGENKLMFMAIVEKKSSFSGPFLSDLPLILEKIEKDLGLSIADATNLDGGSASAFFAGNVHLTEVSPIGSYWCIK